MNQVPGLPDILVIFLTAGIDPVACGRHAISLYQDYTGGAKKFQKDIPGTARIMIRLFFLSGFRKTVLSIPALPIA